MTASLGSNSNDTQLIDDDEYDNLSSVSFDTTLDQTRPSFFEHDSILFPKSKLIDYLNVHNSNQASGGGAGLLAPDKEETSILAANNEPKKESKKEKKLVKALGTGNGDENEVIRLTLMSLELHSNTRANMTPNPDSDSIAFVCYSVFEFNSTQNDSSQIETHLVVVIDTSKSSDPARKKYYFYFNRKSFQRKRIW